MAAQGMPSFSITSVIEDVLRQQGASLNDNDLASRKAEETSLRMYDAARWLRKMVGVVLAKDLPAEPSDDDFRIGLRSGVILCTVLNKIQPGAISKVVEVSNDSVIIPDGTASMAYQYFENVRNFLVAMEEIGLPTFDASDFEKGGNTSRIVSCVLALKTYGEWKQGGSFGSSKYTTANGKSPNTANFMARMNSESCMSSISRSSSFSEKSLDNVFVDVEPILGFNDTSKSRSIGMLVRSVLSGKRQDEIPSIVEFMLNKVTEELESRLDSRGELLSTTSTHSALSDLNQSPMGPYLQEMQHSSCDEMTEMDDKNDSRPSLSCDELTETDYKNDAMTETIDMSNRQMSLKDQSKFNLEKQQIMVRKQYKDVQELKCTIFSTKESIQELQMKYQEDMKNIGNHLNKLTHAASGYQRVLAENRKLYNLVQDLKGNIRVYCRVRPFLRGQTISSTVVDHIEEGTITIKTPAKYCKEGKKSFTFNKVFGPTASQVEVFADTEPLVRSVLDGYNVCIFAYGQTGSGKTFTMSGPDDLSEETFGVNYRALNDLFFLSEQRKDTISYEISVQMMEIYNEQVRDLLTTDKIRNSSQNGINVPDANRIPVSTTDDVIRLMNLGQKNRAVSSTAMNDRSSRSHSCLTVHVQGRELTSSGASLRGCMHLVDLAGSERVEKSEVTGDRLKEAVHINKSLSALGDVIAALAQKGAHVPYRNMSSVELGAAQVNKDNGEVKELKDQIANLKAALAKKEEEHEMLSNSILSSKDLSNGSRIPKEDKISHARRRTLDPRDLSDWPPLSSKKGTSDWVDKIPIKRDNLDRSRSLETLEDKSRNQLAGPYSDVLKCNGQQPPSADEIDESEIATSDSSEKDFQPSLRRVSSLSDGMGSKIRKPQSRKKNQDIRSMIPTPPTRRLSISSTEKNERQSLYLKRKNATSK
ncbi:hypothetical protein V2J09_019661 [Rumex salicifolius]